MDDFYRTNMGHRFFEGTMPQLVSELKRLNNNIEKLLKIVEEDEARHKALVEGGNVA